MSDAFIPCFVEENAILDSLANPLMCSFTRVLPNIMSLPINLSEHEREARQSFRKFKQVDKHPNDIEYSIHEQERLNHHAYCKQCLHVMTSVAFGDLCRLTHICFLSKNYQICNSNQNKKQTGNYIQRMCNFIR